MPCWTEQPEAAVLLASLMQQPPPTRVALYRFQETRRLHAGRRVRRLNRLYRGARPTLDTPEWEQWLAEHPQRMISRALGARTRLPGTAA
ncbi:MAG: hypothetical protein ACT4OE_11695 [Sphingosinicella sp.]